MVLDGTIHIVTEIVTEKLISAGSKLSAAI
jgi:hypothetical protein